jgi:hypothetical protein
LGRNASSASLPVDDTTSPQHDPRVSSPQGRRRAPKNIGERLEVLVERYEKAPPDPAPRRGLTPVAPAPPPPVAEQLATLRQQLETVISDLERRLASAEAQAAVAEAKADAAAARAADLLHTAEWLSLAVTGSKDLEPAGSPPRGGRKSPKAS